MPRKKPSSLDEKITNLRNNVENISVRFASEKELAYLLSQGDDYDEYHKACALRENTRSELYDAEGELSAAMCRKEEIEKRESQLKDDKADRFVNSAIIWVVVFAVVYFISRHV